MVKSSLILLGTALTTVIGYYFGQREGAAKAARAEVNEAATDRRAAAAVNDSVSNAVDALRQNSVSSNAAPPPGIDEQAPDPDVVEPKYEVV